MELKVQKWGNSLAVRLPAEAAEQLGVREGDRLITIDRSIRPVDDFTEQVDAMIETMRLYPKTMKELAK